MYTKLPHAKCSIQFVDFTHPHGRRRSWSMAGSSWDSTHWICRVPLLLKLWFHLDYEGAHHYIIDISLNQKEEKRKLILHSFVGGTHKSDFISMMADNVLLPSCLMSKLKFLCHINVYITTIFFGRYWAGSEKKKLLLPILDLFLKIFSFKFRKHLFYVCLVNVISYVHIPLLLVADLTSKEVILGKVS